MKLEEFIATQRAHLLKDGHLKEAEFFSAKEVAIQLFGDGFTTRESFIAADADREVHVKEFRASGLEAGKDYPGVIVRFDVRPPRARKWQTRSYTLLVVTE